MEAQMTLPMNTDPHLTPAELEAVLPLVAAAPKDGGTLVGIDAPSGSRNLEIKPYVIGGVSSDLRAKPAVNNARDQDAGFDVKYGLTPNVTADITYNTDFAQVEADEQQVNLTRFGLFFPEKREFFLENQGLFVFGGQNSNNQGDTPTLFYSRRIGLESGRVVPIQAGGRVTGRIGKWTVQIVKRSDTARGFEVLPRRWVVERTTCRSAAKASCA